MFYWMALGNLPPWELGESRTYLFVTPQDFSCTLSVEALQKFTLKLHCTVD